MTLSLSSPARTLEPPEAMAPEAMAPEAIDSCLHQLIQMLQGLSGVLSLQQQAIITRNPKQLQLRSEECLEMTGNVSAFSEKNHEQLSSCSHHSLWPEVVAQLHQCKEQYVINQKHLHDLSSYCSQLSSLLMPSVTSRYDYKTRKTVIRSSVLLGRA